MMQPVVMEVKAPRALWLTTLLLFGAFNLGHVSRQSFILAHRDFQHRFKPRPGTWSDTTDLHRDYYPYNREPYKQPF